LDHNHETNEQIGPTLQHVVSNNEQYVCVQSRTIPRGSSRSCSFDMELHYSEILIVTGLMK